MLHLVIQFCIICAIPENIHTPSWNFFFGGGWGVGGSVRPKHFKEM